MPYADRTKQKDAQRKHYRDNKEVYREHYVNYRKKMRKFLADYKAERGCSECGLKEPVCLDFHHPGDKDGNVARLVWRVGRKKLLDEMKKCIIVCANCHRIMHLK